MGGCPGEAIVGGVVVGRVGQFFDVGTVVVVFVFIVIVVFVGVGEIGVVVVFDVGVCCW